MADAAVRVTAELLMKAVGCPLTTAASWAEPIDTACKEFAIKTGPDIAAFLAQTGHESGNFEHVVERLGYTADRIREIARKSPAGSRWRSLGPRADELSGKPQALANAAYGGRMGNGPEASGDGWKYRGRGLIQNTGKANYEAVRDTLREHHISCPDFDQYPDELASPKWAAMAAAAYWSEHDLSRLANAGEFDKITSRVNGGSAGQDDRRARYRRARQALTGV